MDSTMTFSLPTLRRILSAMPRAIAVVSATLALSGCGVDLAFSTFWSASMKAKDAQSKVKFEEDAKAKIKAALETETKNTKAAIDAATEQDPASTSTSPASPLPAIPSADSGAAMRAAEEQSK
jgi:hypothetical protein